MQAISVSGPAPRNELREQLKLLASVDAGEAVFLSCYLDLRDGRGASEQFLEQRARAFRQTLTGRALKDFEGALGMIRLHLRRLTDLEAQGLAVFARSPAGGSFLSGVPLHAPVSNGLTLYRVPDLAPMSAAVDGASPCTLALARNGAIQVIDLVGGHATLRAWAAFASAMAARERGKAAAAVIPDHRLQIVRRALAMGHGTPLVVAGDADCLRSVVEWLPGRVAGRLTGIIDVPPSLNQQDAVQFVTRRLADDRREAAHHLVERLVRGLRSGGLALAGAQAVCEALTAGTADTLLVAPGPTPLPGWACDQCGAKEPCAALPERCPACGSRATAEWRPLTEVLRLAWQQGLRIVHADSVRLRYLGGVACLLKQPAEMQAMPEPAIPRQLDLVA
jgi:hypothetical protein